MLSSESINTLLSPHDASAITMIRYQNGAATILADYHRTIMQLHPTLGNATHLSYKSRLMKHKPAAFITKPRKLKAAYFRVTSNMTACSGFLTLQTQRNLVNLCILLVPRIKDKNATVAPPGVHVKDNRLLPLR
jgi:hypothetical protein